MPAPERSSPDAAPAVAAGRLTSIDGVVAGVRVFGLLPLACSRHGHAWLMGSSDSTLIGLQRPRGPECRNRSGRYPGCRGKVSALMIACPERAETAVIGIGHDFGPYTSVRELAGVAARIGERGGNELSQRRPKTSGPKLTVPLPLVSVVSPR